MMALEIGITPEMRARASAKSKEMGTLRNSITEGEGNIAGFLGEEMFLAAFPDAESLNTYQFDIRMKGATFEIKTVRTSVTPRDYYYAHVANYNTSQRANYYVFARVLYSGTKGWLLGYVPKAEFKEKAIFKQEGELDDTYEFEFRFPATCYNMAYKDLRHFTQGAGTFVELEGRRAPIVVPTAENDPVLASLLGV